mmetsp:Transcript_118130/g.294585  ORF Transcript_118130/g.294585 Transcript_118130/m.294585 type:complete len:209 (+) Transcript_118130:1687-2313(+)
MKHRLNLHRPHRGKPLGQLRDGSLNKHITHLLIDQEYPLEYLRQAPPKLEKCDVPLIILVVWVAMLEPIRIRQSLDDQLKCLLQDRADLVQVHGVARTGLIKTQVTLTSAHKRFQPRKEGGEECFYGITDLVFLMRKEPEDEYHYLLDKVPCCLRQPRALRVCHHSQLDICLKHHLTDRIEEFRLLFDELEVRRAPMNTVLTEAAHDL